MSLVASLLMKNLREVHEVNLILYRHSIERVEGSEGRGLAISIMSTWKASEPGTPAVLVRVEITIWVASLKNCWVLETEHSFTGASGLVIV